MDAQQNKRLVQDAYRLFLNGDIQGVVERCHDDAEWTSPESDYIPFAGMFRGKQGIAEFFSKLGESADPVRFEPQEFIAEGDKVVVVGQATWHAKPTGRTFDSPFTHVLTMRDGKVARFEAYADTAAGERAFRADQSAQAPMGSQLHH
ncbi:MAG: nuclear transport factor 2 family protein [Telluria sp.]